jgi:hypothetical protein
MTYQEALERAIVPMVEMGASPEKARKELDDYVQMNIDYRNFTASKGEAKLIEQCLEYLCDLKEGKTTEDRDVIVDVMAGNVANLKRIGTPSKGNRSK